MTDKPRDELLEHYAEAVAQDTRRPSDRVRNAARAHAQMLRDQAAVVQRVKGGAPPKPAANRSQWTISLVASLTAVGLAGLLYVQIDRGTPEERDAALDTAARMEALQRPDTPMLTAPPIANAPATATPPAKPATKSVAVVRKEMSSGPAAAAVQDAAQTMANATTDRTYFAPPTEADAAPKLVSKATDQIGSTESVARMAPGERAAAVMAPAAPAPAATALAAAAASATPRRAREMGAASAAALFMEAVRTGHTETMQKLLVQGVAVNTRDDDGNTALMLAVRYRQAAAARELLVMGADTSLVNYEGLTALQLASQLGLADMVQLLKAPR